MTQTPPAAENAPQEPRTSSNAPSGPETTVNFGTPEAFGDARIRTGLSDQELTLVRALPRGSALLLVPRGPGSGSRFLLDTERTVAGRGEDSDIFLDDVTVSRKHVEFVRDLDDYRVRDIGSLNGTYVNRERVDDTLLASGDEVQIGKYRLVYYKRPDVVGPDEARTADDADANGPADAE